jgi:hypothetical protein
MQEKETGRDPKGLLYMYIPGTARLCKFPTLLWIFYTLLCRFYTPLCRLYTLCRYSKDTWKQLLGMTDIVQASLSGLFVLEIAVPLFMMSHLPIFNNNRYSQILLQLPELELQWY